MRKVLVGDRVQVTYPDSDTTVVGAVSEVYPRRFHIGYAVVYDTDDPNIEVLSRTLPTEVGSRIRAVKSATGTRWDSGVLIVPGLWYLFNTDTPARGAFYPASAIAEWEPETEWTRETADTLSVRCRSP